MDLLYRLFYTIFSMSVIIAVIVPAAAAACQSAEDMYCIFMASGFLQGYMPSSFIEYI